MAANLIAKASIVIEAPASKVWEALTNPEQIKQWFFGTEAISDWKEGSTLEFKGVWEGKEYLDKGVILKMEPEKLFQYSYFSNFSGLEDKPENYANIIYDLEEENGHTTLTVKQENIVDDATRERSENNWKEVLNSLKTMLEKQVQPV
jgi:uncharacterized protein YndB with AHSA1/START domain